MFVLTRYISGKTENLKVSNSHLIKTFEEFTAADNFAKRLNQNTIQSHQWHVRKL